MKKGAVVTFREWGQDGTPEEYDLLKTGRVVTVEEGYYVIKVPGEEDLLKVPKGNARSATPEEEDIYWLKEFGNS